MRFKINGIEWQTVEVPSSDGSLRRSDGSLSVGVTDNGTYCIYLSKSLRGAFKRKVMIHEVCHAFMFSYGILIPIEQEEFICDFVATYGDDIFDIVDRMDYAIRRVS